MNCQHPPAHIAVIMENDYEGEDAEWCQVCGAYRIVSYNYSSHPRKPEAGPWTLPDIARGEDVKRNDVP